MTTAYPSLDIELRRHDRDVFVARSGTSLQYLRHIAAGRKLPQVETCVAIERASCGRVRCEELRPDVDWTYLSQRLNPTVPSGAIQENDRSVEGVSA
ncbi:MAG TPA: YdaS family helix-turn-helix protein [Burkholderiaceae bacterium]|nr:YdaS family helix-turn-helix protein [Burkholderiaceae bacterium]